VPDLKDAQIVEVRRLARVERGRALSLCRCTSGNDWEASINAKEKISSLME
jgi:hypothetical protein